MADSLRADPAALRAAASRAGAAASGAAPGSAQVSPCAPDAVSVATSSRFGALVDLTRRYTAMANGMARDVGVLLDASGTAYETQEGQSAALLGGTGLSSPAPAGMAAPPGSPATAGLLGGQGLSSPAGEVPNAPRDIARLIEHGRGGPGPQAWQAAETSLRTDARRLDDAADQLGAAISTAEDSWVSGSADIATGRMRALQTWYQEHATYVRGLADYAQTHVQNFRKATTDIPTYKSVVDGERELRQAQEANQRSRGMLKPAVVHAQVKLGQLYQASTTGYASYTIAEAMPEPTLPAPPPRPPAETPDVIKAKGPGDGPVGPRPPEPTRSSAPLDPVQQGSGVGEVLTSSGPTWPPGAPDPAVNKDTAQLFSGVLKDVTTAASGLAGPLASGLAGTVGSLSSGLAGAAGAGVSAASQAASAAAKAAPANAGGPAEHGGSPEQGGGQSSPSPEPPPSGKDLKPPGDGGGTLAGDTEPASGGGAAPLSAPMGAAATPAIAAPASAPSVGAGAPAEASPPAVGAMGPMMAPPMGGRGAGGSGDGEQLYKERQLKVVAPPNSEPVKNRREGRDRGRDRKTP